MRVPGEVMAHSVYFLPPVPERPKVRIRPVFLPFQGCPRPCIFCAQHEQTGGPALPLHSLLEELDISLRQALGRSKGPMELAFYGGTFTAMPVADQEACLALARRFKDFGLISRVRCSTRPDCVSVARLAHLKERGLDMVELGIQTFNDKALAVSRPGCTRAIHGAACAMVREAGLALGLQLMPGIPGTDENDFRNDIETAVALRPETLRLYPCLVIEGTKLAALWRAGRYTPWELGPTIRILAWALMKAERAGIAVIRLGLAPESALEKAVLAGPQHASLGSRVRGLALFNLVSAEVATLGLPPRLLTLPRRLCGEFSGFKGELLPQYEALGLPPEKVRWWSRAGCELSA